jgi:glycosyltransferase involved in cell wall biosynthesis
MDTAQAPFLFPFIEGLKTRGHQVFVFTQDRKGEKKAFLEGVPVKWFRWMRSEKPLAQLNLRNPLDGLRIGSLLYNGRRTLRRFVKEEKVDVCLALWVLPGGYFANQAYRQAGIPYSLWALGSDIYRYGENPFLYRTMKRIIQEARGVFADGFDLSKRVENQFGRKCFFLATTRTLFEIGKGSPNLPHSPYQFLFVGRMEKVKGIDLLLQSAALLFEEALDFRLVLVGKGSMEGWVKSFIHQKGLNDKVTYKGSVEDRRLAFLYASSDCVVIPSRSESIPLVFSEALHFNKALIVTDVGDMGMLGRKYGVAWVVPPEDPMALKEAMKKRAESRDLPQVEGGEGKRKELKWLFNIETSVDRFLEDYI